MSTLIVEMVIIGFQVLIWIFLLILSLFGYDWVDLAASKEWAAPISLGIIGISYTLGIIFDSLTGILLTPWSWSFVERPGSEWLGEGESLGERRSLRGKRTYVMARDPALYQQLDRQSNQVRLLRSTSVNLILIGIAAVILAATRLGFSWYLSVIVIVSALVLAGVSLFVWIVAYGGYNRLLTGLFREVELREAEKALQNKSAPVPVQTGAEGIISIGKETE